MFGFPIRAFLAPPIRRVRKVDDDTLDSIVGRAARLQRADEALMFAVVDYFLVAESGLVCLFERRPEIARGDQRVFEFVD